MQTIFKKSKIAIGALLTTISLVTGVHAKDNIVCFDGVCRVKSHIWIPELGEVDTSQYSEAEIRKILDDFWTPQRMFRASINTGRRVSSQFCGGDVFLSAKGAEPHCRDESYLLKEKMDYWTPERIQQASAVEIHLPNGLVLAALVDDDASADTEPPAPFTVFDLKKTEGSVVESFEEEAHIRQKMDYWTPEQIEKATVMEIRLPEGAVYTALMSDDFDKKPVPEDIQPPLPVFTLEVPLD